MYMIADDILKSAATLTATSTASGFSVNNLKNDKRSSTWRSTAITSQTITATWASAQTVNAAGIAFANFLVGSTVRIKLYTNSGDTSPVVDSGGLTIDYVLPPPSGFSANNLASFAFGGGNYFFTTVAQAAAKKIEIILTNPAGADAFIEAARIVAGEAFNAQYGIDFGAAVHFDDLSLARRTDSGDLITDRRTVSRSLSIDLSMLTNADRASMQKIIRRNGLHTPVYVSAYQSAANSSTKTDFVIYGTFKDPGGMLLESAVYNAIRLTVTEI